MTVSVVQTATAPGAFSGTFASPLTAGSTVILVVTSYSTGAVITSSSPTIGGASVTGAADLFSATNGVQSPTGAGGTVYTDTWLLPNVAGGETAFAISCSGDLSGSVGLVAWEVAGLGTSPSLDRSSSSSASSGTAVSSGASGATSAAPEIIVGTAAGYGMTLPGAGTPWTETTFGSSYIYTGYQIATSSGGSYTYAMTGSPSAAWAATVVTVKGTGGTARTASASLTVTPSFTASPAHGHYRTGSLGITPSFTADRTRGAYRSASLALSPSFTAARTHGHARSASLTVTPSFTAAGHNNADIAVFWAGEARGRWVTGGLSVYTQSVLSTAYVQIPVTAYGTAGTYNPTGDTVQFAFTPLTYPGGSPSTWITGSWVTFPGPSYWAQCLAGPANGGTALSIGTYQIWLKITSNPEVPVLQPSLLEITP